MKSFEANEKRQPGHPAELNALTAAAFAGTFNAVLPT
jgi:hypothetical protein